MKNLRDNCPLALSLGMSLIYQQIGAALVNGPEYVRDTRGSLASVTASRKLTFHEGGTAMIEAIKERNLGRIQQLLDQGVSPNVIDNQGHTALMYAIQMGDLYIIEALLKAGANVKALDVDNHSALFYAAKRPEFRQKTTKSWKKRIINKWQRLRPKQGSRSVTPALSPVLEGFATHEQEFYDLLRSPHAHHEVGLGEQIVKLLMDAGAEPLSDGESDLLNGSQKERIRNVSVYDATIELFGG